MPLINPEKIGVGLVTIFIVEFIVLAIVIIALKSF